MSTQRGEVRESRVFDDRDQVIESTNKRGFTTKFEYDSLGHVIKETDALGYETVFLYDNVKLLSVTRADRLLASFSYDAHNNVTEAKDALGRTVKIERGEKGLPVKVEDPEGGTAEAEYDERGNIISLTDALGGITRYEYDELNRVVKTTQPEGDSMSFSYNAANKIIEVVNAEGNTRRYSYNESGKVIEFTDWDGSMVRYAYNMMGKLSEVTDPAGGVTSYEYNNMWEISKVTDANGGEWHYEYDRFGWPDRVIDPEGYHTFIDHDLSRNVTGVTMPSGAETRAEYDALNRRVKIIDANGAEMSFVYDAFGAMTEIHDPVGNVYKNEYDEAGQLIQKTDPLGNSTAYTYNKLGLVISETNEAGATVYYERDAMGRVKKFTGADEASESYEYDKNGRIVSFVNALGEKYTYAYDCMNRILSITNPLGGVKRFEYDSMSRVKKRINENGNATCYKYDAVGNPIEITGADGSVTKYSYDLMRQLTLKEQYKIVDPDLADAQGENEKISTRYFYDKCGFLAMEVDALGGTTRYEYTPDGRLCTEINKGGDVTEYEYDPIGLLTKTKYSDGQEVMFSYDPLRQLAEMKDALGLTKIKTDAIGRITEVTDPENRTIRYSWTPTGERESITYPDGSVVRYNHDPMGRISQVIDGQETVATYRYDAAGHILERMLPNGVKTEYVYSELGAMKNLIHSDQTGQLDAFSYRYDPVGNKTEIHRTRRLPDGTDETIVSGYVYDQMNRLTEVIKDGAPLRSYGYDALGNRTMRRDAQIGAQTNYRVPDIRFAFDAANRIVAAATASGDTAAYTYDGFGRRVKSVWDKAAVSEREAWHEEQRYILDALKPYENVLMTYSGSGSVRYVWGNELISADTVGVDPTYYLHDELRSLVRTVDVDGGSLSRFDYDEFGVHMPGAQDGFATGGEPFSEELFGFTGYQLDPITGLYYAQARYYMPQAGRFMSADPIKFGNPYTYCYNNPLSFIDPSGLTALKDPKAGPFSITDPDDPKDPYAPYYGGNQAWYPEDWENKSACGPTAAANTLSYLAVTNPDDSALYGYSDFTKKNYTQFMTDVIQDVTPIHFYVPIPIGTQSLIPVYKPKEMSFGVPTLTQYINGVTKYAADKGVTLTATSTSNITMSYSDAVSFIENGLDKNSPVSLLMYTNSDSALSQYQWHWMTITDISYSEKDADYIVTVSSWGQSYKLPLRDIWTKSSYTGLAYFQNTGGCIDD